MSKISTRKIYFISDSHIGHDNLNISMRGMSSDEYSKLFISNWNKVVKPQDKVYFLGDITMDKPQLIKDFIESLNGEIVVIGGNHDTERCCDALKGIGVTVMGCVVHKGYILTHVPVSKSDVNGFRGNIHGHIHEFELPSYKYINVSADIINHTPVLLDYIIKKQQHKKSLLVNVTLRLKKIKYLFSK